MNWQTKVLYALAYISLHQGLANCQVNAETDAEIIARCLDSRSNNIEILRNYTNWSVEEIPCFARCITDGKGWFNVHTNKWNKEKITEELGDKMYNYCRFALDRPFENVCDFTYEGLRCLKQAEQNIPLLEAALIGCTLELNISLQELAKYIPLQINEKIPCYFECFARKMNLYSSDLEWNVNNWIKAFGTPYSNINLYHSNCKATTAPQANNCTWMYAEYLCVDHLSYHPPQQAKHKRFL